MAVFASSLVWVFKGSPRHIHAPPLPSSDIRPNMYLKKHLLLAAICIAAFSTSALAQIAWTNQSPSGLTDDIWCVNYANGTFAASTSDGKVLTSTDGLAWSTQTVSEGTWLVSIAYGNGDWVAVGAGGTILVSPDLKTWVSAKAVTSNKLNGVLYAGGLWVAVGDSATVITSPDAINWTVQAVPAGVTGFLHGITAAGSPGETPEFYISGAETGNGTGSVNEGAVLSMYGNPTTPGGQTYTIYTDGVGANLIPSGKGAIGNLEAILFEPTTSNLTVAVGWGGVYDGYPESGGLTAAAVPSVVYRGLTYGNGFWVAAGEQGTIVSSQDGLNWTQRFSGESPTTLSTATLLGAAYSSSLQRFVIVGTGGTILDSNSTPTVFANVSTRGYVDSSVPGALLDGGFVITGTAPRQVLIRADGPALSTFNVSGALPDPVLSVYASNGIFVASNAGWTTNTNVTAISTAALEVGAFALPNPSKDSALLITLPPGAYTVEVTSAGGNSGIALFEAYTD